MWTKITPNTDTFHTVHLLSNYQYLEAIYKNLTEKQSFIGFDKAVRKMLTWDDCFREKVHYSLYEKQAVWLTALSLKQDILEMP